MGGGEPRPGGHDGYLVVGAIRLRPQTGWCSGNVHLRQPTPVPRREIWTDSVRNEQRRIGWKYPPEIYATRFRRRGSASKDPREMDRLGA